MHKQHQSAMNHEQQYEEEWSVSDDSDEPPVASVNHSGKSALYVVGYFALLAILMYPAQRFHLGAQSIFFAMIAAGLLLALCLLLVRWGRYQLAQMHLSPRGLLQLLVGYQPTRAVQEAPTTKATRLLATTSLAPLADQRLVRYGEALIGPSFEETEQEADDHEEEEDSLPERIVEENPLYVSDTFQPDVNSLLGATALLCGMRRTGKSNGIAVLAEEIARYYCPLCIGDTEDEYGPLADHRYLPRGCWAASAAFLSERERQQQQQDGSASPSIAIDLNGAYAFGQAIVRDVLQVVLHLKSFESDEEAALIMTEIIYGVHDWEASRPNRERVPCTFILDEASKWLPQRSEESTLLDKEVLTLLQQALFGTVVRRGGKQGLGLVLATQRIAELDKRALQSQWKFLFKQTEPIDIALYARMGLDREEVVALRQGECFIFSPSVIGFRTQVRQRSSPHLAHTPGLSELVSHLRRVRPLEVVMRHYTSVESSAATAASEPDVADAAQRPGQQEEGNHREAPPVPRSRPKTELERALDAYQENPLASYRELGEKLGIGKDKAGELIRELRERGMIEQVSP